MTRLHALKVDRQRLQAVNGELLAALHETAFRLAALVAASGDFSDIHAKALDAASVAIQHAEAK